MPASVHRSHAGIDATRLVSFTAVAATFASSPSTLSRCKITSHAVPSSRRLGLEGRALGKTHRFLPPEGKPGSPPPDRRGISGVQRRAAVRSLPHFLRQDARSRGRHDHRPHDRGCNDARRHRRLRRRDDGSRPGRLHHQHGREPVSRSASCAEFHASSRLAVRRRRGAVRARHHPHLRRAVSGDGAARDRRLHPRFSRPVQARRPDHDGRASLSHGAGPAEALPRMRGAFGCRARRAGRGSDLYLVAGRQLDRDEHRVSRAAERQHADDRSESRRQRGLRHHPRRQAKRLRHSRRRLAEEFLPAGTADIVGGLRDSEGRQRLLHSDHDRLRWSGAGCRAPRPPKPSAGAR